MTRQVKAETPDRAPGLWAKVPISLRAIISGFLIAMPAANVWPLLLRKLGVPFAAMAEAMRLLAGAAGGGSRDVLPTCPASFARRESSRR